jgi:hypothetical protein
MFLLMRSRFPQLERAYRSPLGAGGAVVGIFIFALCLIGDVMRWADPDSSLQLWPPLVLLVLWFSVLEAYFHFYARHRIKLSPEEEFCMYMVCVVLGWVGLNCVGTEVLGRDGSCVAACVCFGAQLYTVKSEQVTRLAQKRHTQLQTPPQPPAPSSGVEPDLGSSRRVVKARASLVLAADSLSPKPRTNEPVLVYGGSVDRSSAPTEEAIGTHSLSPAHDAGGAAHGLGKVSVPRRVGTWDMGVSEVVSLAPHQRIRSPALPAVPERLAP